jgi:hypothetical protein
MADVVEEKGSADIHESPQTKAGSDPVDERGLHRHSKKELEQLEELVRTELSVVELSDAEKKRVLRKIDWILVPQLALLYLLGFLDRGNSKGPIFLTLSAWRPLNILYSRKCQNCRHGR